MIKNHKWSIDSSKRICFGDSNPVDITYNRTTFKIGCISFLEEIRIVKFSEYSECNDVNFIYARSFFLNNSPFKTRFLVERKILVIMFHLIYHILKSFVDILNFFFQKDILDPDIKNSKYIKKYKFIEDIFPEISRNRKLEELIGE